MVKIFWNKREHRLRAGWRIAVLILAYNLLASLIQNLVYFITNPISDASGITGKIAAYVRATGNFPVAATAPDYLNRLSNYAHKVAGLPLQSA